MQSLQFNLIDWHNWLKICLKIGGNENDSVCVRMMCSTRTMHRSTWPLRPAVLSTCEIRTLKSDVILPLPAWRNRTGEFYISGLRLDACVAEAKVVIAGQRSDCAWKRDIRTLSYQKERSTTNTDNDLADVDGGDAAITKRKTQKYADRRGLAVTITWITAHYYSNPYVML